MYMPIIPSVSSLVPGVINPEKRGKIEGSTFHVFFFEDNISAAVFDKYMDVPIIYGNKTVVKATVKRLKEHLPETTRRVRIFFYKVAPPEFKMKMKYEGPVETISVPTY